MRQANAETEGLTLAGVDLVELYSIGMDVTDLGRDPDDIEGVILYAQLLEATIAVLYNAIQDTREIAAIRDAARESATMWRKRVTNGR